MSILDSVKSRFRNNDEEEFERAFREGRFPEGVDDFEPLSNTGHFLASDVVREEPPLPVMPEPHAPAPLTREPSTQPAQPRDDRAGVRQDVRRPSFDGVAAPADNVVPMPGAQGRAPMPPRGSDFDEGVQVYERDASRPSRASEPVKPEPFADRLRARVAAANVSGQTDEGLGRSRVAVDQDKVVRASGPVRPARPYDEPSSERPAQRPHAAGEERAPRVSYHDGGREGAPARREQEERRGPQPRREPEGRGERREGAVTPLLLPTSPVVIRPRLYDDVREIAAGVVTKHQPAVLVLNGTSAEVARRVMDFSFGLCCGTGARMEQLGDRVYAVIPRGVTIGEPDIAALKRQGILRG